MSSFMEGKVEAVSPKNGGIKLVGLKWFNKNKASHFDSLPARGSIVRLLLNDSGFVESWLEVHPTTPVTELGPAFTPSQGNEEIIALLEQAIDRLKVKK